MPRPNTGSSITQPEPQQTAHGQAQSIDSQFHAGPKDGLEFYRTFVQLSAEGIWWIENDPPIPVDLTEAEQIDAAYRSSYFAECNRAYALMNGADSPAAIKGRKLCEVLASAAYLHEMMAAFIASGYHLENAEFTRVDADGTERCFLVSMYGVIEAGLILRAWGTQQDVTARMRADRIKEAIYEISQASSSTRNLQELFKRIHEILAGLMPANNLFIALYDQAADLITFPYFVDEVDEPPEPEPVHPRRGLTEYILRTGQPLLVDPEQFEALVESGEVEMIGAPSIDWLGVPLIMEGRASGVLAVQTYNSGIRYTESEKEILVFVSTQIAMAIERKRADERLRMDEARFRAIVEDQTEFICRFLPDTTLTFVNEACCRYYGKKREELIGTSFSALAPEEDRPAIISSLASLTKADESRIIEHRGVKAGGVITWEQWSSRAIFDELGNVIEFQSVGRDITDRKRVEDELRYLSTHDRLTGIYNRAYFEEEMNRLTKGRLFPVSIIMADVDGLKAVNDSHGHTAGDELLRQAAQVLRSAFRAHDVVARVGGDEFGILLSNADAEVAQHSLERIRKSLFTHNNTTGNMLIRLSMGSATAYYSDEMADAYKHADSMMYQEKYQVRSRVPPNLFGGPNSG